MKYKNGREVKPGDHVVGLDWRGIVTHGIVVTGDTSKGHPALVFQHGIHKTVCPSLELHHFFHADDAVVSTESKHTVILKDKAKTEPVPVKAK